MNTKIKISIIMLLFVVFTSSVLGLSPQKSLAKTQDFLESQKSLELPDGSNMVLDFENGMVKYENTQTPIITDPLVGLDGQIVDPEATTSKGFVHKPYYDDQGNVSLDVYIEDTFYAANQAALDDFWDKFNVRFEILKQRTGWSSKKLFGVPLEIYNYGHSAACYGGNASPTHSNVVFSDPMYKTGCNKPYYENGSTHWNNPGELGDWWPYMNTALHEATHSIMPYLIYTRSWLTEGWAEYEMYNTLTETVPGNTIPDINQETADTYLYNGFAGYQWDPYVANDYHDTTIYNRELQRSHGYDITGHMFSKMRDEEGMDWDLFYHYMNNNKESLDRTFSLGPPYIYYTDAFVLYVFGLAMGHTDYYSQTDLLFNYYSGGGVDGHGYGARNISYSWTSSGPQMPYADFDWFGDLEPIQIDFSNNNPEIGEQITITATIHNNGDVNLKNNSVRIYIDDSLAHEEHQDINKFNSKTVQTTYTFTEFGDHTIKVVADEEDIKIELDNYNNEYTETLNIEEPNNPPILGLIGNKQVDENQTLSFYVSATDPENDTLTYYTDASFGSFDSNTGLFEWTPTFNDSGNYTVTFNVTDGEFWDEETITITVNDVILYTCGDFDDNQQVNILDIIFLIDYKFKSGPAPNPLELCDVDLNQQCNILDIIYLIDYKFKNGPAPIEQPGLCTSPESATQGTQQEYDQLTQYLEQAMS